MPTVATRRDALIFCKLLQKMSWMIEDDEDVAGYCIPPNACG